MKKQYRMEQGGYIFKKKCALCNNTPVYRAFYYPTYMNGDAEWLGDYCENHRGTKLEELTLEFITNLNK